jgi:hypothetical protein
MKYFVLLAGYGEMTPWEKMTEAEQQKVFEQHMAFPEACAAHGVEIVAGEPLEGPDTATTMRTSAAGEVTLTDGPFAEAAEQIGGFYVLDAPNLDVLVEVCKALPPYDMELRPIMDIPQAP